MLAIIEHELNFSEDEINFTTHEEIRKQIGSIKLKIHEIIKSSVFGRYIHSGVRVVLIGKPNSGKSSLFNSILGHERAIVSDEPGTTRDTIEAWIELAGLSVCLVDTAGVWESENVLEKLGIEKTFEELKRADLFILIDDEDPSCLLNYQFSKDFNNKYILVKSKCDGLSSENINGSRALHTSSLKSKGIDILLTHLSTLISKHVDKNMGVDYALISGRQRGLLVGAYGLINDIVHQIDDGVETDIVASGLRGVINSIKDVVGDIPNQSVLDEIFGEFCIGK
jgi:tRNA modification GTPase